MYTLTFIKTKAKNFPKALQIAEELGAKYDGETVRLEFPTHQLLYMYETLLPLIALIQNWKDTKATYKGKRVGVYRFVFLIWRNVRMCAEEMNSTSNERYCWHGTDSPGWGCRLLDRVSRKEEGPGNYKTSSQYWYNFGEFDHNGDWIVNKRLIIERLMKEAEEKALDTCPFFSLEKIQEAVQDLPEKIIPDNLHYRKFYIRDYIDGVIKERAVNIRHMKPDTRPPDLFRDVMKRDDLLTRTSLN